MSYKLFQMALHSATGEMIASEVKFHDKRRWRFDFAILELKIAIEIEGGAYTNGRHTRGKGFIADMEKYNEAVLLGWNVLRFTPAQLNKSKTILTIKKLINEQRAKK